MLGRVVAIAGLAWLAGCERTPKPMPFDDLGGALRVSFAANPDISHEVCRPRVSYAYRSEAPSLRVNVTYLLNNENYSSSNFAMRDESEDQALNILTDDRHLTVFEPYPLPCSELTVAVQSFTCQAGGTSNEDIPCPAVAFVGTEMFASFTEPVD